MDNVTLSELIFPDISQTVEDYYKMYPDRSLPEGSCVTRFAPSPTGFVHIGNFLPALIDYIMAKSMNGIFVLRFEDTDKKREVESAASLIMETLRYFGIMPDEYELDEKTVGDYGPYTQSKRKDIYHAFHKKLVALGRAYPCFCKQNDMEQLRAKQEEKKLRTGYYGEFAACRDISNEKRAELIRSGAPFALRFRSEGDHEKRFTFFDAVKGELDFPENDQDLIIMKTENHLPTYHFAHVVDDTLMRITHAVRGEEWLSSTPMHIEMFEAFGLKPPIYVHNPLILKRDQDDPNSVRKISKRKDPEALMDYYIQKGYPPETVVDAMMMIINSNYEDWRPANKDEPYTAFEFSLSKMSASGAFFDLAKLNHVSREIISRKTKESVFEESYEWAKNHDADLTALIERDPEYYKEILDVERNQQNPRKDIAMYSGIIDYLWYMYDDLFESRKTDYLWPKDMANDVASEICSTYLDSYYTVENRDIWFSRIKEMCVQLGYASEMKEYKKNPDSYKGSLNDVVGVLRMAVTTSSMTFDLYSIMRLLGYERLKHRMELAQTTSQ